LELVNYERLVRILICDEKKTSDEAFDEVIISILSDIRSRKHMPMKLY